MKKWLSGIAGLIIVLLIGLAIYGHFNADKLFKYAREKERAAANLVEKTVTVNGISIHYLEGGIGEPIVLVHGFGADKDNWTRVSRYLTPHVHVVALDLPGFGDSDKRMDLDYSLKAQAERLNDFIDTLKLGRIHLGGSSMGGAISGFYAAMYPGKVKSLWLLAPGNVNAPRQSELSRMIEGGGKNPLIIDKAEDIKDTLDFVFFKKPFIPPAVATYLGAQAAANKPLKDIVFKSIWKETRFIDSLLAGSDIPTLVVWGKNDRVLDASGADVLCKAIKQATCVTLDQTGHLPMIERPEKSADAFLAFFEHL